MTTTNMNAHEAAQIHLVDTMLKQGTSLPEACKVAGITEGRFNELRTPEKAVDTDIPSLSSGTVPPVALYYTSEGQPTIPMSMHDYRIWVHEQVSKGLWLRILGIVSIGGIAGLLAIASFVNSQISKDIKSEVTQQTMNLRDHLESRITATADKLREVTEKNTHEVVQKEVAVTLLDETGINAKMKEQAEKTTNETINAQLPNLQKAAATAVADLLPKVRGDLKKDPTLRTDLQLTARKAVEDLLPSVQSAIEHDGSLLNLVGTRIREVALDHTNPDSRRILATQIWPMIAQSGPKLRSDLLGLILSDATPALRGVAITAYAPGDDSLENRKALDEVLKRLTPVPSEFSSSGAAFVSAFSGPRVQAVGGWLKDNAGAVLAPNVADSLANSEGDETIGVLVDLASSGSTTVSSLGWRGLAALDPRRRISDSSRRRGLSRLWQLIRDNPPDGPLFVLTPDQVRTKLTEYIQALRGRDHERLASLRKQTDRLELRRLERAYIYLEREARFELPRRDDLLLDQFTRLASDSENQPKQLAAFVNLLRVGDWEPVVSTWIDPVPDKGAPARGPQGPSAKAIDWLLSAYVGRLQLDDLADKPAANEPKPPTAEAEKVLTRILAIPDCLYRPQCVKALEYALPHCDARAAALFLGRFIDLYDKGADMQRRLNAGAPSVKADEALRRAVQADSTRAQKSAATFQLIDDVARVVTQSKGTNLEIAGAVAAALDPIVDEPRARTFLFDSILAHVSPDGSPPQAALNALSTLAKLRKAEVLSESTTKLLSVVDQFTNADDSAEASGRLKVVDAVIEALSAYCSNFPRHAAVVLRPCDQWLKSNSHLDRHPVVTKVRRFVVSTADEQAKEPRTSQEWERVRELRLMVAAWDPKHGRNYFYLGEALEHLDHFADAFENYSKALTLIPKTTDTERSRDESPSYRDMLIARATLCSEPTVRDYVRAESDYSDALKIRRTADVVGKRAQTLMHLGRRDEALADCEEAIKLSAPIASSDAWLFAVHADIYAAFQMYDDALPEYTKAIEVVSKEGSGKDQAEFYNQRGTYYFNELRDYEKALADYSKAVDLDATSAMYVAYRGDTYRTLKRYQKAVDDLKLATMKEPDNAEYLSWYAQALWNAGRFKDGELQLKRAATMEPRTAGDYLKCGNAKARRRDFTGAVASYTKAIELRPKMADAYVGRSSAKIELERINEAIDDASRAIQVDERSAACWSSRAEARFAAGRYGEAVSDFTKALQCRPREKSLYKRRGDAERCLGDDSAAIRDYTDAIIGDDRDAQAFLARGKARMALDQGADAHNDFLKAIQFKPRDADEMLIRAEARLRLGQTEEAVRDCLDAVSQRPDAAGAYALLGSAYHKKRQPDKAREALDKAIQLNPRLSAAHFYRSALELDAGHNDEANRERREAARLGLPEARPDFPEENPAKK